ncbi:hypothetical protein RIR_jg41942.t1 [Rhizophagus irregularis DAOM 181602=DAOM 197198]|nr:hypothetical protein RIR_jg41942.t1 [Rhizophagus irregularis DAOM 181602=DAOM 197198]
MLEDSFPFSVLALKVILQHGHTIAMANKECCSLFSLCFASNFLTEIDSFVLLIYIVSGRSTPLNNHFFIS